MSGILGVLSHRVRGSAVDPVTPDCLLNAPLCYSLSARQRPLVAGRRRDGGGAAESEQRLCLQGGHSGRESGRFHRGCV